jgi:hypothetical protein
MCQAAKPAVTALLQADGDFWNYSISIFSNLLFLLGLVVVWRVNP